jgi:O-antigen ligase
VVAPADARPAPRAGRWTLDRAGALFLLVAAYAVVPKVVQTLTAPKYYVGIDEAEPPLTAATALATSLLTAALLGLCLLLSLDALRRNPRRDLLGVCLLLAPWAWLLVRDLTLGSGPGTSDLVYPALVVTVWLVRPGLEHLRLLGWVAGAVAVVSVLVGLLLPASGLLRAEDGNVIVQNKSFLPSGILVGVFTHGNTLGQFLLLGLPLVALVPRRGWRAALLAVTAAALVWSQARSSIGGAVVLALVAALLTLLPLGRRAVPGRLVVGLAFVVVAVLPFLPLAPGALSSRGGIWANSLGRWREHPWVGLGSDYYARTAQTTADLGGTVYHGHNEVVQLLVTGGVVLAVLVGLLVLAAAHRATSTPGGVVLGTTLVLAVACASLLEISLLFRGSSVFDPVLLLPLATLLVGEPLGAPRRHPDPHLDPRGDASPVAAAARA